MTKKFVVIGAGLSGLSYAYYLKHFLTRLQKSGEIIVLEASKQINEVNNKRCNFVKATDVKAKNTLLLLEQLGHGPSVVTDEDKKSIYRCIYHQSQIQTIIDGLRGFFRKLPFCDRRLGSVIYKEIKTPVLDLTQFPHGDPTVNQYFSRRLGPDVALNVLQPLARGQWFWDPNRISAKAVLNQLIEKEQKYGSIIKGGGKPVLDERDEFIVQDLFKSKLVQQSKQVKNFHHLTLDTGFHNIKYFLCDHLIGNDEDIKVKVFTQSKVVSLDLQKSGRISLKINTSDLETIKIEADHVVSSVPSPQLVDILGNSESNHFEIVRSIVNQIPHRPLINVCLEYQNFKPNNQVLEQYGVSTHPNSGSNLLSAIFESNIFPSLYKDLGVYKINCHLGGSWFEETFNTMDPLEITSNQVESMVLSELKKILGIEQEPSSITHSVAMYGLAEFLPGHVTRMNALRQDLEDSKLPLTLVGPSYEGSNHNEYIYNSRLAAYKMVNSLK